MLRKFKEWFENSQENNRSESLFSGSGLSERIALSTETFETQDGTAMTISIGSVKDIPDILNIQSLSFGGDIPWNERALEHEIKRNTNAMYLMLRDQDLAVAFVGAWFVDKEAHITNIAVIPNYRNKGVATCLITEVKKIALLLGMKKYSLEVRVSNDSAIRLYTSLGFDEGRIKKGYYASDREDALEMSMRL